MLRNIKDADNLEGLDSLKKSDQARAPFPHCSRRAACLSCSVLVCCLLLAWRGFQQLFREVVGAGVLQTTRGGHKQVRGKAQGVENY